jgi:hypothetical protein
LGEGSGNYTGNSSYTLQSGSLSGSDIATAYFGKRATAEFNQSAGTVSLARTSSAEALIVGDYATGTYALTGGTASMIAGGPMVISHRGGTGSLSLAGADAVVRVKGSAMKGGISLAANFSNSSTAKGSATVLVTQGTLATNSVQRGQLDDTAPSNGYGSVSFTMGGGMLRPYDDNAAFGNETAARNFDIILTGTGSTISGLDDFGAVPRTVDLYANLSGAGGATFSGGTVNIRGVNTHAGLTTIAAGGMAALLGTAGSSSGVAVNGTLDLASQTSGFTFGSAQTVSGTGGSSPCLRAVRE